VKLIHITSLIVTLGLLTSCNLPLKPRPTLEFPTAIPTQAAQTPDSFGTPDAAATPLVPPSATDQPVIPSTGGEHKGDLVTYTVQAGDSLPALAQRFQTSEKDITALNPWLVAGGQPTTLPPGRALSIRLAVKPDWDSQAVLLPDYLFVNGPAQVGFDVADFLSHTHGWLKDYLDPSTVITRSGAKMVEDFAQNYSISPRLLLALLEYQLHALSQPDPPASFSLGSPDSYRIYLSMQLSWAANALNNGYYGWRQGDLTQFNAADGSPIIPSPWENAASIALRFYFSRFLSGKDYQAAVAPAGLLHTYQALFGGIDWSAASDTPLLPGNLRQPELTLPFHPGLRWALTGGPHSGWGVGDPLAALDFAPPSTQTGCDPSPQWATAVADGVVAHSADGLVVLDLDGDGNIQTGWTIQYLHIDQKTAPALGTHLKTGDLLGHPSCDGGHANGRNLHIARLYNGEWIPIGGAVPFVLDGWTAELGEKEYLGTLRRGDDVVTANPNGEWMSLIEAGAAQ